jgi:hypothetical protein
MGERRERGEGTKGIKKKKIEVWGKGDSKGTEGMKERKKEGEELR